MESKVSIIIEILSAAAWCDLPQRWFSLSSSLWRRADETC